MIVLCRIDDRLIHGQVTVGWSRFLDIQKIVVISDELANDEMQTSFLAMAVPENAAFAIGTVADIAERLKEPEFTAPRTCLLAASPREFRSLIIDHGADLREINIGGQRYVGGQHQVCDGIHLTDEALSDLRALHAYGVAVEVRIIPSHTKQPLFNLYKDPGA